MRALVKWKEGFYRRGTGEMIYAQHPDYTVKASVDQLVDAELAEATDDASTVAIGLTFDPKNDDEALYDDVNVGDAVQVPDMDATPQTYRAVGDVVTEDQFGTVATGLEVNSRFENDSAAQKRWLEQIAPGSLAGRLNTNVSSTDLGAGISFAELSSAELGTFTQSAYVIAEVDPDDPTDPGHSEWWPVDENIRLYRHPWALNQAGTSDTVVGVRYRHPDKTTIDTFPYTIKAGVDQPDDSDADHASFYTNLACQKDGAVQVYVVSAGDFAYGLTWRTKYTSQV